jgi:hypothetical protein
MPCPLYVKKASSHPKILRKLRFLAKKNFAERFLSANSGLMMYNEKN